MCNIADALQRQCAARPSAIVIQVPEYEKVAAPLRTYRAVTFGELEERISRLRTSLLKTGLQPGDRCALMVPPSIEFVELTFALFSAGMVPVFIDPGIGLKNLKACLKQAEPKAFIGVSKAHVARLLFGWAKESVQTLVTVGRKFGWGGVTLDQLRSESGPLLPPTKTRSIETAAILFTSGSTGVPKGAVYTHGMFLAQLEKLQQAFDIQPGEVDLCTFPLFALFGPALGMTSVIPLMNPTRPALVDPDEILGPIASRGVTNLFGSPALLNRVSQSRRFQNSKEPLVTLKRVLSAGAPVAPSILERITCSLPSNTQVFTPYGATEALPVAIIGSNEVLQETRGKTAQGAGTCVGRPVKGLDVAIIQISDDPIPNWSQAIRLPTGQIGEIVVNGPQVTQEYFRRPELTALAKIADDTKPGAWHRMGDVGYFDDQGRLWFCGRKSQRVQTHRGSLFTDPVEGIFNTHPAVFRSALVGVAGGQFQLPVVCIELAPTAGRSRIGEIRTQLRTLAESHELTKTIETFLFHPRFPVDIRHNSKIFREKLARWASRRLNRN